MGGGIKGIGKFTNMLHGDGMNIVIVLVCLWMVLMNGLATLVQMIEHGPGWSTGVRDQGRPAMSVYEGRAERIARNNLENVPLFFALALAVLVAEKETSETIIASWVFMGARVTHACGYLAGIVPIRSVSHATCLASMAYLAWVLLTSQPA